MPLTPETAYLLNVASASAMAAVLWVVQLAIYPLFNGIGIEGFTPYHRRYTTAIGWIVGPLMLAEAGATLALWLLGERSALFYAASALLGLNWVMTALVQVPLHRQLSGGFDATAHRRLVWSNWFRTAAWTARAGLLLGLHG